MYRFFKRLRCLFINKIKLFLKNDFCEGGSLAGLLSKSIIKQTTIYIHSIVNSANEIIPSINNLTSGDYKDKFDYIVATSDWHPINHISFASNH